MDQFVDKQSLIGHFCRLAAEWICPIIHWTLQFLFCKCFIAFLLLSVDSITTQFVESRNWQRCQVSVTAWILSSGSLWQLRIFLLNFLSISSARSICQSYFYYWVALACYVFKFFCLMFVAVGVSPLVCRGGPYLQFSYGYAPLPKAHRVEDGEHQRWQDDMRVKRPILSSHFVDR